MILYPACAVYRAIALARISVTDPLRNFTPVPGAPLNATPLGISEAVSSRRSGSGYLEAYLGLYADTPYAGPLIRERETCARILDGMIAEAPGPPAGDATRSLLAAMGRASERPGLVLSPREMEVLQRLKCQKDKQIAFELGLTAFGVRYHIRKLFAKLGVRSRAEAVRRAREMGLVKDELLLRPPERAPARDRSSESDG